MNSLYIIFKCLYRPERFYLLFFASWEKSYDFDLRHEFYHLNQLFTESCELRMVETRRTKNNSKCTGFQIPECVGYFFCVYTSTYNNNGSWNSLHNCPGSFISIHTGHVNVHGYYIRLFYPDEFNSLK